MTETLVPSPTVDELTQKAALAIPAPVTHAVKEGVSAVQAAAPQLKTEARVYIQSFRLKLEHLIFLGFFTAVFFRTRIAFNFDFSLWLNQGWNFSHWLLGGLIGWNLLFLDNVVYLYFLHPEEPLGKQAREIMKSRGLWEWLKFMIDEKIEEKLTLRSVLFQTAWVALAIFSLTSTISFLGKGVVMGLGLHLLLEQWQLQRLDPPALNRRLFWQIKRKVSLKEQQGYLWIITGIFAVLSLLV